MNEKEICGQVIIIINFKGVAYIMKIKPSMVIVDLEEYIRLFNISLSEGGRRTLMEVEEFAYRCDNPVNYNLFFSKVIRNSKVIQSIIKNKGTNHNLVSLILEKDYYDRIDELSTYEKDNELYSQVSRRINCEKTAIIDKALEYCVNDNRTSLENEDIFLAAMDDYEKNSEEDGGQWADKELNKSYTTLSHVYGRYNLNLWIKFDDIRDVLLSNKKGDKNIKIA